MSAAAVDTSDGSDLLSDEFLPVHRRQLSRDGGDDYCRVFSFYQLVSVHTRFRLVNRFSPISSLVKTVNRFSPVSSLVHSASGFGFTSIGSNRVMARVLVRQVRASVPSTWADWYSGQRGRPGQLGKRQNWFSSGHDSVNSGRRVKHETRLIALVHSLGILQSLLVRYFKKFPNATTVNRQGSKKSS